MIVFLLVFNMQAHVFMDHESVFIVTVLIFVTFMIFFIIKKCHGVLGLHGDTVDPLTTTAATG